MAQVPEARHEESAARERVLDVAEALFQERGLARVTMRDVADALGMRQASLYHHAPGGKAQLYREVFERMIDHHKAGLEAAVRSAGPEVRARLRLPPLPEAAVQQREQLSLLEAAAHRFPPCRSRSANAGSFDSLA